jgi:hypothetical protein
MKIKKLAIVRAFFIFGKTSAHVEKFFKYCRWIGFWQCRHYAFTQSRQLLIPFSGGDGSE